MDYINLSPNQEVDSNGIVFDIGSLYDYFTKIPDTRKDRGKRFALTSLLVMMVLAKLGGEDKPSGITDWVAERAEQLKSMRILTRDETPCHMTYRRLLQDIVDAQALDELVQQ